MKNNIVIDCLKEKDYLKEEDNQYKGISILLNEDEVVLKGNKLDLIELANLLVSIALADEECEHLHIDDLTLINKESEIKNLIIEKSI